MSLEMLAIDPMLTEMIGLGVVAGVGFRIGWSGVEGVAILISLIIMKSWTVLTARK